MFELTLQRSFFFKMFVIVVLGNYKEIVISYGNFNINNDHPILLFYQSSYKKIVGEI